MGLDAPLTIESPCCDQEDMQVMTSYQTNENIPNNHVLAVLSETGAQSAIEDLKRGGFDSIRLFRGESAAIEMDAKGGHSGPVGKVVKMVQEHLSEEPNFLAQYEEESRHGNVVLAVRLDDHDKMEAVKEILERHSARNIRYFGTMAVTDLSPLTNPSLRSSESPEEAAKR